MDKSIFGDNKDLKMEYIARLRKIYDLVDVNFSSYGEKDFYCLVGKKIKGAMKYGIILGGTTDLFIYPQKYSDIMHASCVSDENMFNNIETYQSSDNTECLKFTYKDETGKKVKKIVDEHYIYEKAKKIKQEKENVR